MLLLALSTGHKLGLGLAVAIFAGFSLIVAMLVPRYRPEFPGRGLGVFLVACVLLFAGMLAAVEIFGKEGGEAKAEGERTSKTTATGTAPATSQTATSQTATTQTATTQTALKVGVSETEFKIKLDGPVSAGRVSFDVSNDGNVSHDFVIKGAGVDEKTSLLGPGKADTLSVELKAGTYDVYCSVPGHKQAGMDLKLNVS